MPAAGENFYILDITFMHGGKGFGDDLKDFSKEEGLIPSGTEYSHLKMKFPAIFHFFQIPSTIGYVENGFTPPITQGGVQAM